MKIVYCLLEMNTPGGIGRVASLKANYLADLGWDVYIITTDQDGQPSYYYLNSKIRLIDLGLNIQENLANCSYWKWYFRRKKIFQQHFLKLSSLLDEIKPDFVVSTFSSEANFLYKIKDGSKKILECHFNHDYQYIMAKVYGYGRLKSILVKMKTMNDERLVKKYDAFVCLTHEDKQLWPRLSNIYVIPNMTSFSDTGQNIQRENVVLAVGHFNRQKSFDKLIRIWRLICSKHPQWSLHIYGAGEDEAVYRKLINKLDLNHSVLLHKPTGKIQELYTTSSILCMTSTYEGLPMVLLEAMACGLPCIAYTCKCGPKDVIADNVTGFLIPEDDERGFAEKLSILMGDVDLRKRMVEASYARSVCYSQDAVMAQWSKLFNSLVK